MPATIALGVATAVISSLTQSVGLTLQRKSHLDAHHSGAVSATISASPQQHHQQQPIYKRPLWRLGFALFLAANLLGSSVQITTLPLIVLSPLQAIGLVFNSLCACFILGEEFSQWTGLSMGAIGLGALLIAYFGSSGEEENRELNELLSLLRRAHFVAWMVVSFFAVVALFTYLSILKLVRHRRNLDWCLSMECNDKFRLMKGCIYGVISGTLSAHSLLFAKISVEIVLNAIYKHDKSLRNMRSWAMIFAFLSLALIQLWFLNKGLKNISTSILYPLVFCTYNIVNITNGLIFYNKLSALTFTQTSMIIFGTALVLAGVFALSVRLNDDPNDLSFRRHHRHNIRDAEFKIVTPETRSLLGDDDEELGYVSFASPSKVGDPATSPVSPFQNASFSERQPQTESGGIVGSRRRSASFGSHSNHFTPFKYGSIIDNGRQNTKIGRGRRVLSFEQNELLSQMKQLEEDSQLN